MHIKTHNWEHYIKVQIMQRTLQERKIQLFANSIAGALKWITIELSVVHIN